MQHDTDIMYMTRALALAEHGRLTVAPNPMVGCVIVQNGSIVGEGYHRRAGEAHAEIHALTAAGNASQGATVYISLEPCCHHGRTPPCTDALIKAGIHRVVIACTDPNPRVAGNGIKALLDAGISVTTGVLENKANELNEIFFHYMTTGRPFVISKWAMSLDGCMSTTCSDRLISNQTSHQHAHQTREMVDGILIGKQTAISDDPLLTIRYSDNTSEKKPARIILTSESDLPSHLRLLNSNELAETIVVTTARATPDVITLLADKNITVMMANQNNEGKVDLQHALELLGKKGLTSILVEGGKTIHEAFFKAGLVNKVNIYLAPIIIGNMPHKININDIHTMKCDSDFFFSATFQNDIAKENINSRGAQDHV